MAALSILQTETANGSKCYSYFTNISPPSLNQEGEEEEEKEAGEIGGNCKREIYLECDVVLLDVNWGLFGLGNLITITINDFAIIMSD